jgi:hypothetical protein
MERPMYKMPDRAHADDIINVLPSTVRALPI